MCTLYIVEHMTESAPEGSPKTGSLKSPVTLRARSRSGSPTAVMMKNLKSPKKTRSGRDSSPSIRFESEFPGFGGFSFVMMMMSICVSL